MIVFMVLSNRQYPLQSLFRSMAVSFLCLVRQRMILAPKVWQSTRPLVRERKAERFFIPSSRASFQYPRDKVTLCVSPQPAPIRRRSSAFCMAMKWGSASAPKDDKRPKPKDKGKRQKSRCFHKHTFDLLFSFFLGSLGI